MTAAADGPDQGPDAGGAERTRIDADARDHAQQYIAGENQYFHTTTVLPPRPPAPPSRPIRLAPRPPQLVGRDAILDRLRERLTGAADLPCQVVVYGLGGVGKTSLVLEYAHRYQHHYGLVWQITAEDATLASMSFAALAAVLGARGREDASDPVHQVHALLAARGDPWLLILDNVPDAAALSPLLPPGGPGHVLVTSRASNWPPGRGLELPVLEPQPASAFLLGRDDLGRDDFGRNNLGRNNLGHDDFDRDDLSMTDEAAALAASNAVVTALGALPLALEQARAYMAATGSSLTGYLELLHDRQAEILAQGEPWGYAARVASAWQLSFDRLTETSPQAIALLRLLACYAPDAIPYSLLLAGDHDHGEAGLARDHLPRGQLEVNAAVSALRRYSLIGRPRAGLVSVHRLVQAVTLNQLTPGERDRWHRHAAALAEAALPADPDDARDWPRFAQLLPHARKLLDAHTPGFRLLAFYLGASGDYRSAGLLYREVAAELTARAGADHPDTLSARQAVACLTGEAGDATAARDRLAVLLAIRDQVQGSEHPDTLSNRHDLAYWTGEAGDATAARDQFAALLPLCERVRGPENPHTLIARHELARFTGEAGDPAGARDQLAALLPAEEAALGAEHPVTLITRHDLARFTGQAGDPAAARDQLAALLPAEEAALGAQHPHALITRHELARFTGEAGDPAGARDQLAALLPIREHVLGAEHPHTLLTRRERDDWTAAHSQGTDGRS
ncbi:tetratricopeptide repeat protein [Nonomuraea sp. NPDC050643]|uniref:tetratricopeptide repeat protein n=1 Tax=Nonomuraea sp. NPDC050643 TaxID=3155660 RepID=UPI0034004998